MFSLQSIQNQYLCSGQLKKYATSMSSKPVPMIYSGDTLQELPCFDHNMECPISKMLVTKAACLDQPIMAGVWLPCCATSSSRHVLVLPHQDTCLCFLLLAMSTIAQIYILIVLHDTSYTFFQILLLFPFNFWQEVVKAVECSNFGKLKYQDQLRKEKEKGNVFLGFGMFFNRVNS